MKSIGFKLWAGMMTLVVVVLVLLWLFQIVFLESFYTNIRVSDIKNEGISISKLLADESKTEFENKADAFAFNNNLSIELMDLNGDVIYTAGTAGMTGGNGQMSMMQQSALDNAYKQGLAGKETKTELTHPRFGNKFMLMGIPVIISGKLTSVLIINLPIAPVRDTVAILKRQLVIITLIMLLAALIISYLISRTFTKPILEIKRVSEKMASGDFSHRIEASNNDEIGKLAETINYMGQELSKIEQLRKDLIANVSHELRTPLSIIRGYAETIKDISGNDKEKREKHVGIIIDESERLSSIVDDILNLSQMQEGLLHSNTEKFAIGNTIENVIKRYEVLSEKTNIKIGVYGIDDATIVVADEKKIEQVLYNLINNAFNHTLEGGNITVKATQNSESVKIEVIDTGVGISDQDMKHVWDRYYKADKSNGRKTIGTGLGLAIVKNILEDHKVPYGVASKEGSGTTFWFELKK
jgi:signal transduction histidine kinase